MSTLDIITGEVYVKDLSTKDIQAGIQSCKDMMKHEGTCSQAKNILVSSLKNFRKELIIRCIAKK